MKTASTTAEDILNCAQSLIVAGGYNGFSYADISKVVGIRNASIHHYFPAKSDLVRKLVIRYREQATAGIAAMDKKIPKPLQQLRAYTGYWEACITDATAPFCVCALLATQMTALPEDVALEVRAHFRTLSGWLTTVLERGVKDGSLKLSGTPRAEAETFLATVHGAMLSARAYGDVAMFGAIVSPLLARLTAGGKAKT
ncbi:MAG: TetR/AcrR family transcriptional regulator [Micavibrio sp.]|nr:TetR/AcrR family transcriptional regulator [Micavibrio sp.]